MAAERQSPRKGRLSRAARDLPIAAIAGGIGYGIARTGMELFLGTPMGSSNLGTLRQYAPAALGAVAAYAGLRGDKALRERAEGKP